MSSRTSIQKHIVIVTTADTDILTIERAMATLDIPDLPNVRVFNPGANIDNQPESDVLAALENAGVVVLRLLGGKSAMGETFGELVSYCREYNIPLIACPGHQEWDEDLITACSVPVSELETTFSYLMQAGVQNFGNLILFLSDSYLDRNYGHEAPEPVPWEGVYHPDTPSLLDVESHIKSHWNNGQPNIGLLFYRAHWMSGNLQFIDDLIRALESQGANVLPVFSFSLKHNPEDESEHSDTIQKYLIDPYGISRVDCVINTMGLAMSDISDEGATIASGWATNILESMDVPVIQGVVSTSSQQEWRESDLGLGPIDTAMNVALPEFDGRIISVPFSFKEETTSNVQTSLQTSRLQRYVTKPDRVETVAKLATKWANLRRKQNPEKRLAIIMSNYPTKDARIGNAVGLDTPASVVNILNALSDKGYVVHDIPKDGDELVHRLIERCSNDTDSLTEEQLRLAAGHISDSDYSKWFDSFPAAIQNQLQEAWGDPPGQVYRTGNQLAVAGLDLGNVFVGLQPPRGFGEHPISVYHSPDLTPTHHYIGYYRWIKDVFQADAMVHVGKHGTLEWLPGKGIGLSEECYPEVALQDMPLFYPFIINNPGEGTQAKRRTHATIIDHLIPPMTTADSYGDIAKLEQLMDEHYQCQTLAPVKLPILESQIWDIVKKAELHRDLGVDAQPDDFGEFMLNIDGYLCEIKDVQIKDGLHILGEPPSDEHLVGLMSALTRLDMGEIPSLRRSIAEAVGLNYENLLDDPAQALTTAVPQIISDLHPELPVRSVGDVIEGVEELCRLALSELQTGAFNRDLVEQVTEGIVGYKDPQTIHSLSYASGFIYPSLMQTTDEIDNLLRGLDGRFVPAGPSGSPTRGLPNVLPTGRNFYSVDPKTLPSPAAWEVGKALGDALLSKYLDEENQYPEMVGIVVWGTSAMRTHGDDIAQILYLLGVRPVWQQESRRVSGIEVIPLEELGRPRIDVTVRISGFFRDAFPNLIYTIDQAIQTVASLTNESPEENYIRKHLIEDTHNQNIESHTELPSPDDTPSLFRIFGSKPGTYGAGILQVLDERNWETVQDLAEVYTAWGGYAYTQKNFGVTARNEFRHRFSQIVIAAKNQDNREHDIFDSDDYMQYHGGMIATVRALTGQNPREFFGDSSDPNRSKVRDLQDEARRVFRSRVVNPKWIDSMKRHGYKGAFELSATVDYMFGYDATANVVEDWMYENVTEEYVLNEDMQEFFKASNPWALRGIVERLLEAIQRGLWEDPPEDMLADLQALYLELETDIEARQE